MKALYKSKPTCNNHISHMPSKIVLLEGNKYKTVLKFMDAHSLCMTDAHVIIYTLLFTNTHVMSDHCAFLTNKGFVKSKLSIYCNYIL